MKAKKAKISLWEIEPKHRPWLFLFGSSKFLLTGATILFWAVFQGFVLKRLGDQYVAHFFLLTAAAALIGAGISIRLLRNWSAARQGRLFLLLGVPAALALAIFESGLTPDSPFVWRLAFVILGATMIAALVQSPLEKIKVVMADAMSSETLSKIEPLVTGSANLGIVITGLFLAIWGERLGSSFLFWTAALMTIAALPLYLIMEWRARVTEAYVATGEKSSGMLSFLSDFPTGAARKSVIILTAITALTVVFGQIFNYEFILATGERFVEESQVSAFIGGYFAVAGVASALFVAGARRFLLRRFGLTRNLHVPTLLVAIGVIATFFMPTFVLVIGVVFLRDIIMTVQQYGLTVMLQSVSDRQRNQAWSWMDGPVAAIAGVAGSALLLLFPSDFWGGAYGVVRVLAFVLIIMLTIRFILTHRLERTFPGMLTEGLLHGDFKTRIRAMSLMSELKYLRERRLGTVLDVVRNEAEPPSLRLAALKTLGELADSSSLRVIAKLVSNPNPEIRLGAIRSIMRFDFRLEEIYKSGFSRETLIIRLREIFKDESDPDIVQAILDALIALRDEEIVKLLTECLASADNRIKRSCLLSLRNFSDAAVIDRVRELLDDPDPAIQADAIAALWQFPWERSDKLEPRLKSLLAAPSDSQEYRWGLYLAGELGLERYHQELLRAIDSESTEIRLTVSISLLKLGDIYGMPPLETVLAEGDDSEAKIIARLTDSKDMPEISTAALEAAIHRYHLHYPPGLPVTEPLRRRLADIPKQSLVALRRYYDSRSAETDRSKIESALSRSKKSSVGCVALLSLTDPWRTMAAVHLLSFGYEVRVISDPVEIQPNEIVIADEDSARMAPGAIVLSVEPGERRVVKSHYAPSELRQAIEDREMEQYL